MKINKTWETVLLTELQTLKFLFSFYKYDLLYDFTESCLTRKK